MLSQRVYNIIPYLLCIIILLYIIKPSISFKPNNKLREFGFGYDSENYKKTLYTMSNIIIFTVILLLIFI